MTLAILQGFLAIIIATCGVFLGFASAVSVYQADPKEFEQFKSLKEMKKADTVYGICIMSLSALVVFAGVLTYAAQS